jgi:Fe-S-cluster containining protein
MGANTILPKELVEKANVMADEARNSISKYCCEECHAYCCRKGYLVLKKEEVDVVTQGRREELIEKKILKDLGKNYSLFMGNYEQPCPSLDEKFMCKVHKSEFRSKVCGDFPLFIEGDLVRLSIRCPAVKENLLFPFVKQLQVLGFKIVKPDSFGALELYNVKLVN